MTVKAKIKKDILKVKALIVHDMITYDQAKRKSEVSKTSVEANFVTHITASVNGITIYDASTSQFLSKNPIIKFRVHSSVFNSGDRLELSWVDKLGHSNSKKVKIK